MDQSPTALGTLRVALLALTLAALAGCGQKGDLVLPPAATDKSATAATPAKAEQAEPVASEPATP